MALLQTQMDYGSLTQTGVPLLNCKTFISQKYPTQDLANGSDSITIAEMNPVR